ncbi:MAG: SMI1/KNR4 family protein [Desulfobacterales bacterium]|nr:SMI1/KNR4 family protein [Desulfobacterales bacterium]
MISKILIKIQNSDGCDVFPAQGQPKLASKVIIPEDMRLFYELCGGVKLFSNKEYHWRILAPNEIALAEKSILDESEIIPELGNLFLIADDGNGDYLAINLDRKSNGYVVDAFHETFGVIGDTPVIAFSFTELLESLYENSGEYPFWLSDKSNQYKDWFEINQITKG